MRHFFIYLVTVLLLSSCKQTPANSTALQNNDETVVKSSHISEKIFEYLRRGDSPDRKFTLMLSTNDNVVKGTLFGPDPEGENGVFYFRAALDSISIDNNKVRFSCYKDTVFEKPFTLQNYKQKIKDQPGGFVGNRMLYRGYLRNDTLKLCTHNDNFYPDTMIFLERKGGN
jgi:hypothetical protein